MKRFKLNKEVRISESVLRFDREHVIRSVMIEDTQGEWVQWSDVQDEIERVRSEYWEGRIEARIKKLEKSISTKETPSP